MQTMVFNIFFIKKNLKKKKNLTTSSSQTVKLKFVKYIRSSTDSADKLKIIVPKYIITMIIHRNDIVSLAWDKLNRHKSSLLVKRTKK